MTAAATTAPAPATTTPATTTTPAVTTTTPAVLTMVTAPLMTEAVAASPAAAAAAAAAKAAVLAVEDRLQWMEGRMKEAERKTEELEEKVRRLEREGKEVKEELRALRDRQEEERWGRRNLEERMEENHAAGTETDSTVVSDVIQRVVREVGDREKEEEVRNEWKSSLSDVEKRLTERINEVEGGRGAPETNLTPPSEVRNGGEERGWSQGGGRGQRCVFLTDSNGRGSTEDSIKNHIPPARRNDFIIRNVTSYTTDEACHRVGRGEVDVRGAVVVVDNLTNDVRGTRQRAAVTPDELIFQTDKLRRMILAAGAAAIIVCEIKPMWAIDVTPYNSRLHEYLRRLGGRGYGCETQVRLDFLRDDGFHVKDRFNSVLDETYACAIMGIPVPHPTPRAGFMSAEVMRRREAEWPALPGGGNVRLGLRAEGHARVHGWSWQ